MPRYPRMEQSGTAKGVYQARSRMSITESVGVSEPRLSGLTAPPAPVEQSKPARRPRKAAATACAQAFRENPSTPVWMMATDIVCLQLTLALTLGVQQLFYATLGYGFAQTHRYDEHMQLALGLLAIPVGLYLVRLYPGYGMTDVERLRRRTLVTLVVMFGLLMWCALSDRLNQPLLAALTCGVYALAMGCTAELALRHWLIRLGRFGTPVVILGGGRTGAMAIELLSRHQELGLVPIAVYDDNDELWGKTVQGVPVLGPLQRARKRPGHTTTAIIAMPGLPGNRLAHLTNRLPYRRVVVIPDLMGLASLWVSTRDMGGLLGLEVRNNLLRQRNWVIKRAMDLALGLPLLVLALPVIGVLALAIRWASPGASAFYAQQRVGLGSKRIRMWKLRTMRPDADKHLQQHIDACPIARDEWQRFAKLKNDPRIIPGIGRLLRRTSLDELPQLFNVVRGEMSLVGPRPFPAYHVARFDKSFRALRRTVLPGLTGLWQVSERSEACLNGQQHLDTYYIRNWSIWLDLHLLTRTAWVVIRGKGAY